MAIATSFGCPFEGDIDPEKVVAIAERCAQLGFDAVALADTTGMATPRIVERLCDAMRIALPKLAVALHFHNTRDLVPVHE